MEKKVTAGQTAIHAESIKDSPRSEVLSSWKQEEDNEYAKFQHKKTQGTKVKQPQKGKYNPRMKRAR